MADSQGIFPTADMALWSQTRSLCSCLMCPPAALHMDHLSNLTAGPASPQLKGSSLRQSDRPHSLSDLTLGVCCVRVCVCVVDKLSLPHVCTVQCTLTWLGRSYCSYCDNGMQPVGLLALLCLIKVCDKKSSFLEE